MKKLFLILLFTTSIFAQSGKMMLLFGEESYQPLTIVAATANYVIDDGGGTYFFQVAGIAGKPFKVDWGDGTISQITFTGTTTNQRIAKTYASAGTYNVKIYGWNDVTRIIWLSWNAGNLSINNLPGGLNSLTLFSLGANITGSINNLPAGITSLTLFNLGANITYTSPHVWSPISDYIRLEYLALDVTEVDNILCDVANSNNLAGTRTLKLVNNAIPSAAGVTCKTTLQTQGWTVTTN